MPAFFPKVLYKGRARIEQAAGKLKRFKRIALRQARSADPAEARIATGGSASLTTTSSDRFRLRLGLDSGGGGSAGNASPSMTLASAPAPALWSRSAHGLNPAAMLHLHFPRH